MPSVKTELYPSKYISAADLQNKDVAVTIDKDGSVAESPDDEYIYWSN